MKWKALSKNYELYIFLLPALLYFAIFHYWPMYGVQIAFKNYVTTQGIWGSSWVGLKHFSEFVNSYLFWQLFRNTIEITVYSLVIGFPVPIILALMMNELRSARFKKAVQTITYAPHFISTIVLVSMLTFFLSPQTGLINKVINFLGGSPIPFLTSPEWFKTIYVFSGVWQTAGWSSIIYMAALATIDPQINEAAVIDGASRMQRIWYINIPGIFPTIVILLILSVGNLMSVGFEKIYLMQNPLNMESSDIITTYVYRRGIQQSQYSFASAVGLFNSIINFILLVMVNRIAKSLKQNSLW
ncbi:ABC transporter permease [Paenibacillus qinlingensis]|uniref:ABC transporter permease n=1 Tax=Paenibacillus qinlingensis TaxID=1837343 RepID=UPI001567B151|nr:ABC transporter permease subunit [Paenibacillus qinlingensis]NQX58377.1 sugar ABC transporter permease [Paenibacillus qinlingensis]